MSHEITQKLPPRAGERGFSLLELLTVVGIIAVLMTLAFPGLRRSRQQANAGSAVESLRVVASVEAARDIRLASFATWSELAAEGSLQGGLAAGVKSEYAFTLTVAADGKSYTCRATPLEDADRLPHFFIDQTGVIRSRVGAPADSLAPPIPI